MWTLRKNGKQSENGWKELKNVPEMAVSGPLEQAHFFLWIPVQKPRPLTCLLATAAWM